MKQLVAPGVLGWAKDEGDQVLPDWAAGTGYEPCAWTDRPAGEESPFPGGIGEARQRILELDSDPSGRFRDTLRSRETNVLAKNCEGGLYPQLPTRRASDNLWMTRIAEGLL